MHTGGNQDLVCAIDRLSAVLVRHLDLGLRQEVTAAADVVDAVVAEVALVDAVEALDVGVALRLEARPVEASHLGVEAVVARLGQRLGHGCGVPHHLFGHTSRCC